MDSISSGADVRVPMLVLATSAKIVLPPYREVVSMIERLYSGPTFSNLGIEFAEMMPKSSSNLHIRARPWAIQSSANSLAMPSDDRGSCVFKSTDLSDDLLIYDSEDISMVANAGKGTKPHQSCVHSRQQICGSR